MTVSGSASFYLNRGGNGGSGSGGGGSFTQTTPPGFKHLPNPNISVQANSRGNSGISLFQVENQSPDFPHGITMTVTSSGGSGPLSDPVKKKRGRPRKYGPDGPRVSLGLSSALKPVRAKGRPPGTGRKQQLANLGGWMNRSAGLAFTPHVINVREGEDIAEKIWLFAQSRPRALCILSASGAVSLVALRQHSSSTATTITYEGRFQILCLSGSYLVAESGGAASRTGGLSISVSSRDGNVFGGAIGGRLIASSPVQVALCSFVYDSTKSNDKLEGSPKYNQISAFQDREKSSTSPTKKSIPNSNSSTVGWQLDRRNPRRENDQIDLMRG